MSDHLEIAESAAREAGQLLRDHYSSDLKVDEMAAYDIWLWKDTIATGGALGLPDGSGEIERNEDSTPPAYQITIRWSEKGEPRTYTMMFQDDPRG